MACAKPMKTSHQIRSKAACTPAALVAAASMAYAQPLFAASNLPAQDTAIIDSTHVAADFTIHVGGFCLSKAKKDARVLPVASGANPCARTIAVFDGGRVYMPVRFELRTPIGGAAMKLQNLTQTQVADAAPHKQHVTEN